MGFKKFKKEKWGFKRPRIKYNLKRERMKNVCLNVQELKMGLKT